MLQKILSALKNTASDTSKTRTQLIKQCKAETDLHEFDLQLAVLVAGREVGTMRSTRNDITTEFYWSTGIKPKKGIPIMASEKKAENGISTLSRAILKYGPIVGADLAMKTGIAARNIDTLLERANAIGGIQIRVGFNAEKGKELKHYMTRTQADEWDDRLADARIDVIGSNGNSGEHYAAHAMSAPELPEEDDAGEDEVELELEE